MGKSLQRKTAPKLLLEPSHFPCLTGTFSSINVTNPDLAIFGKKDYQQLAIIRRLTRDLSLRTNIIGAETHREQDGLAMSSRNRNLTTNDRSDAPRLRKALIAAENLAVTGERNPARYLDTARHQLKNASESFRLDYLELVSRETLQPIASLNEPALMAIAAFYGEVRLIDNIEIDAA